MGRITNSPDEELKPKRIRYSDKENDKSKNESEGENSNKNDQTEMTIWSKMCFGMAGAPYQMLFVTIGLFSNIYLLENVQLPPEKTLYN
jgi:hypothetical protein